MYSPRPDERQTPEPRLAAEVLPGAFKVGVARVAPNSLGDREPAWESGKLANLALVVAKWHGLDDGLEGWFRGSRMGDYGAGPRAFRGLDTREGVHGAPLLKRAG